MCKKDYEKMVTESESPEQDPILKKSRASEIPYMRPGDLHFSQKRMVLNYERKLICQRSWQFYGAYLDLTDRGAHEGLDPWKVASIKL